MAFNFKFKFNFKKILGKKGHGLTANGPDSDWHKIFWIFGILILLVLLGGLYIFFMVESGTLFTVPPDPSMQAPRLNINLLNQTISYYQDRGSDFQNIQATKEVVKDPSQ
jgi:hypothetical protein